MKVNKALMAKARFERKLISELTVLEFKQVMHECFVANESRIIKEKARKEAYERMLLQGVPQDIIQKRLSQTIFNCQ